MERRLSSGQPLSAQHAVSLEFYICVNCWLLAHESCNSSQAETKKCWARNGQIWNKIAILGEIHCWVSWLMGRVLSAPLSPSQQPNVFFQSTKIILGPSDTWSMRWSTQRPNILTWRLLDFTCYFCLSFRKITWVSSQQPITDTDVKHLSLLHCWAAMCCFSLRAATPKKSIQTQYMHMSSGIKRFTWNSSIVCSEIDFVLVLLHI